MQSSTPRDLNPSLDAAQQEAMVAGHTEFTLSMYKQFAAHAPGENFIYSAHSISSALAMTYAGARGQTKAQMAQALHFIDDERALHAGFNHLDLELLSRPENAPMKLRVVNTLFGQVGHRFEQDYLDLLAANYGAGLSLLNFREEAPFALGEINNWVEDMTEGKIKKLLNADTVNETTRLVLVNAIYLNAPWKFKFKSDGTERFQTPSGAVDAPMMVATNSYGYRKVEGLEVVSLPYEGDEMEMVLLAPPAGTFSDFEGQLTTARIAELTKELPTPREVNLRMPSFEMTFELSLKERLKELGMVDAFGGADFSGIDGTKELVIQDVRHKAFIKVDERGTEAAAATGVGVGIVSIPQIIPVTIDRPFVFLIRDRPTGAVLFSGRVLDPTQED